jgi:hypothetical protein
MPREYGAEPSYGPWAVAWGPWHMAFGPLPSTFGCLHRALGLRNRVTRSELACGREVSGVPGRAVGRQVLTHSRQRGPQSRHRAPRSRQSAPRCRPQGAQHRKMTKHVRDHRQTMTNHGFPKVFVYFAAGPWHMAFGPLPSTSTTITSSLHPSPPTLTQAKCQTSCCALGFRPTTLSHLAIGDCALSFRRTGPRHCTFIGDGALSA